MDMMEMVVIVMIVIVRKKMSVCVCVFAKSYFLSRKIVSFRSLCFCKFYFSCAMLTLTMHRDDMIVIAQ